MSSLRVNRRGHCTVVGGSRLRVKALMWQFAYHECCDLACTWCLARMELFDYTIKFSTVTWSGVW